MESLNLNKSDLKYLLVLIAFAPVLSFIGGAGFTLIVNSVGQQPQNPLAVTELAPSIAVASAIEAEPLEIVSTEPVEVLEPVSEVVQRDSLEQQYIVQAGVFSSRKNARNMVDKLRELQLTAQVIREPSDGYTMYRVILGAFASPDRANDYSEKIKHSHQLPLYVTVTDSMLPLLNIAAL
ncbi:sporulation related protein [Alteromonadaceae bacterium 2753L.S.0a.02]|nr:sporulation related protein [Alteromonadaceae bacterium 2753L.S.0a.02]